VVIGNFDGVHRGHVQLLRDASLQARELGLTPLALTFDPHPASVVGREPPAQLTRKARKLELLHRIDPSLQVHVATFNAALARQSAAEFAQRTLAEELRARLVVVGQDFRFGSGRTGNLGTLVELGRELGFEARAHELVGDTLGPWSSTRARTAIASGDVEQAEEILGRPHMLSGVVVKGAQRGRTLGFPTCNVDEIAEALPAHGVYAVLVDREEHLPNGEHKARALARGVANVGVRPTVDPSSTRPSVEVHLFDIDEDLYGASLRVHLLVKLRAEQRFPDFQALRAQIDVDARRARDVTAGREGDERLEGAFA
jgi:riboflavin kinase/FMN adenylyltransferase